MFDNPFVDWDYPELGEDKIVLRFDKRSARQALKIYAKLIEESNPNLAERILARCDNIQKEEDKYEDNDY